MPWGFYAKVRHFSCSYIITRGCRLYAKRKYCHFSGEAALNWYIGRTRRTNACTYAHIHTQKLSSMRALVIFFSLLADSSVPSAVRSSFLSILKCCTARCSDIVKNENCYFWSLPILKAHIYKCEKKKKKLITSDNFLVATVEKFLVIISFKYIKQYKMLTRELCLIWIQKRPGITFQKEKQTASVIPAVMYSNDKNTQKI